MKSIIIFAILLIGSQADEDLKDGKVEIQVVDSIKNFIRDNPDVSLMEMTLDSSPRLKQILYTVGARKSGDRIVATDGNWAQYPSKQNLELSLWYPLNGVGAVITYVQVLINQDDGTFGRGYVVSGGIGQRNIKIVVEAWNTAFIRYDFTIFGI